MDANNHVDATRQFNGRNVDEGPPTDTGETPFDLPWVDGMAASKLPRTLLGPADVTATQVTAWAQRGWRPRPDEEVAQSWLRQATLIRIGEVTVRIQGRLDEPNFAGVLGDQYVQGAPDWPLATPLLILGTVRGSSVVNAHEARACQDELLGRLEFFRMRVGPAWNIDRGHEWLEPSCICLPTSVTDTGWQVRTLDVARRMGINTAIRIKETVLEVLALEPPPSNRYSVVASTPASITRDVEHRCPMTRAPGSGEYCPMRGGPWTSNAMRAAATWRDYRNLLVQAVGCDTCEGQRYLFKGEIHSSGGPISLVSSLMTTRWLAGDCDYRPTEVES
jgi:hypothetical protein